MDPVRPDPALSPRPKRPAASLSLAVALLAVCLFVPLFRFRGLGPLDFWAGFGLSIVVLTGLALGLDSSFPLFLLEDSRSRPLFKAGLGLVSAMGLYALFLGGNLALRWLLPSAGGDIGRVYGFRAGSSALRITLLLAFLIGPGEEIFWRGYLQRAWQARFGAVPGYLLAAALYAGVHLGSGNPVLVLAAAAGGLFWGFLFLRFRSPLMLVVSHTAWDLAAFVLIPFS
jgi:membrane protease YdiL (CAAX protease family)